MSQLTLVSLILLALSQVSLGHNDRQSPTGAAGPVDHFHANGDSFDCHAASCSFCVLRRMKAYCANFCDQCVGTRTVNTPSPPRPNPNPNPSVLGDFDGNDVRGAGGPTGREYTNEVHTQKHDFATCCRNWNRIPSSCYYLCDYNQMQKNVYLQAYAEKKCPLGTAGWPITRCAADGKDHSACCRNLGMHADCVQFCNGASAVAPPTTAAHAKCLDQLNYVRRCFEK